MKKKNVSQGIEYISALQNTNVKKVNVIDEMKTSLFHMPWR
jgi:hypothetical protein